jgi:hypothetical protein
VQLGKWTTGNPKGGLAEKGSAFVTTPVFRLFTRILNTIPS